MISAPLEAAFAEKSMPENVPATDVPADAQRLASAHLQDRIEALIVFCWFTRQPAGPWSRLPRSPDKSN